jgi:integrase
MGRPNGGPRMGELRELVLRDYAINGRRSAGRARAALSRLELHFDVIPPKRIHDLAANYVLQRSRQKAAPATIRYELAMLRRGLNLAFRAGRLDRRPMVPGIRVQNARTGFFDQEQVELLIAALPDPIDDMARFGYVTGWRISEIMAMTWEQVDRRHGVVRLDPGTTKNDEGRSFPYGAHPELSRLMAWRYVHRSGPHVFHRNGLRVRHIRGAWNRACAIAGVSGRLFHDLRRSAVRNMERAGIPRSVQMTLVGFKTESIHRRYAITNENDLAPWVSHYAQAGQEAKEAAHSPGDGAHGGEGGLGGPERGRAERDLE